MPRHSLWKNCHIRTDRASVRKAGECKTGRVCAGPEKGWVAQYNGRSNAVSTDIRVLGDIGSRGYYENYYFTSEKNEY